MDQRQQERAAEMYATAATIRALEERLLRLFSDGALSGTTHTCLGQEGISAALKSLLHPDDFVFSSHRCHGHYVMYGGPLEGLLGEVMGRECGVCGGRGGSQHLHYRRFFSSGVQGGIAGNATGAALALKQQHSAGIAIVFLGDGTMGEGLVYESLNFASLHRLPVLFIVENNRIAQSTPSTLGVSGQIIDRARAFGIAAGEIESNDALELHEAFTNAVANVRSGSGPFFQIVNTFRMGPHSKGDDTRTEAELAPWREKDPLRILAGYLDSETVVRLDAEALARVDAAQQVAQSSPHPDALPRLVNDEPMPTPWATRPERMTRALNAGLHAIMAECPEALFLGEDVLDPYGGAFKASLGLSTAHPARVISTPISEAGIVAWSIGTALAGCRPIAEIMFGDFTALAADQLINHAPKYGWVSGGDVSVSLVVRTPMGGRRGYGPTHSQSIEKHFLGVDGLRVIAANLLLDPEEVLRRALLEVGPVLLVENKVMYTQSLLPMSGGRVGMFWATATESRYPALRLWLADGPADAVLLTYGGMASDAMLCAEQLMMDEEVSVHVVVATQLSPLPVDDLLRLLPPARTLLVVEEAAADFGWGAEVLAMLAEEAPRRFERVARHGAACGQVPAARTLENKTLPSVASIKERLVGLMQ